MIVLVVVALGFLSLAAICVYAVALSAAQQIVTGVPSTLVKPPPPLGYVVRETPLGFEVVQRGTEQVVKTTLSRDLAESLASVYTRIDEQPPT